MATIDLSFLYASRAYQKASADLLTAICERKGFVLLTGAEGAGKTTLLCQLMHHADACARCLFFDGTTLPNATFDVFLHFLCTELGLHQDRDGRPQRLQALGACLVARAKAGGTVALLIDGAHNLTDEVLGSLRLLSPLDMDSERPLLQIVLAGLPQLEGRLAHPKLRNLRQRIAVRCRLQSLEEREVALFIHHRLRAIGSERQDIFAPEVLQRITMYSEGTPGLINRICDNALLSAPEASTKTVSVAIIDEVAQTLQPLTAPNGPPTDFRKATPTPRPGSEEDNTIGMVSAGIAAPRSPYESQRQVFADANSVPATSRGPSRGALLPSVALSVLLAVALLYYYRRPSSVLAPALPRLPEITRATPPVHPGQELVVAEGQRLLFAVEATTLGSEPLRYVWFLNGREQAQGTHWTYEPQFDEGGPGLQTVTARVSGWGDRVIEHNWRVRVQDVNRPPAIAAAFPPAVAVELPAGQEQRFALEAVDPDTGDQLTYRWAIDGEEVAHGPSWTFAPAATAGEAEHKVTAYVSDESGGALERQWAVAVKAMPLPPPLIAWATPPKGEVAVAEGQELTFSVEAASAEPESLQYVWLVDGRARARGPRWSYRPGFDEGGAGPKAVIVRVTDRGQHAAERTWQLAVQDVNRPPVVTAASPAARRLTMSSEAEQSFSAQATDPDKGNALVFVWSLNGREVARGQTWRFRPHPALSVNRPHHVQVEVADGGGLRDRLTWRIIVKQPALPPQILDAQPADEQVVLQAGSSPVFAIRAELPNAAGATLRYEWKINDAPPRTTTAGHFQLAAPHPGRYQLTAIAVSPEGVKSAPRKWTVEVRPPTPAPPSVTAAARPPATVSAPMSPDAEDVKGRTALMLAAMSNHPAVAQALLAGGADVNARDPEGWTALMYAAWNGSAATVQIFLDGGADANARGNDNETVLTLAARQDDARMAQLLKKAGARE
jgi:general secretion pathway protein A